MEDFLSMLNPRNNKRVMGAITILLLILITPFVTMAFVMMEIGRYENTVVELDQAMGVSTISLLANYDKYLHQRFGLYALKQNEDLNALYNMYMTENTDGLRFTMNQINSYNVTGIYPLSEEEVFRKQIDEYMSLNGPATVVNEFLNLSSILGCFDNLSSLEKAADCCKNGMATMNDAKEVMEDTDKLEESSKKLDGLVDTYDDSYTAFSNSVDDLIEEIKNTPTPAPTSTDGTTPSTDPQKDHENAIATLAATAKNKRDAYSQSIQDLIDELTNFKTLMSNIETAKNDLAKDAASFGNGIVTNASKELHSDEKKEIKKQMEGLPTDDPKYVELQTTLQALQDDDAVNATAVNYSNALNTASSSMSSIADGYSTTDIEAVINSLKNLKTQVDGIDIDSLTEGIKESDYHKSPITGYLTQDELDQYFEDQADNMANGSLRTFLKGIGSFFKNICKCSGVFDPAQTANVNKDYYKDKLAQFTYPNNGEVTLDDVIESIFHIVDCFDAFEEDFHDYFPDHPIKLIKAIIGDIIDLVDAIIDAITKVLDFAHIISDRIAFIMENPLSVLNEAVYAGYNMTCRTGNVIIGQKDSKAFATPGIVAGSGIPGLSQFAAIIDEVVHSPFIKGGEDYSFTGCELEYILFGTYSEMNNQIMAFAALYYLRLIIDAPAIALNAEVEQLATEAGAASYGIGAVAVYLIEIFCEPLVDTLLLVNGSDVPFIKSTIYLTPSGIPELIMAFVSITLTSTEKNEIVDSAYDAMDIPKDKRQAISTLHATPAGGKGWKKWGQGLLSFNYRDYLFIYLMLESFTDPMVVYRRIANIVLMEETQYYHNTIGEDAVFRLDEAYTMVKVDTEIGMNPLFAESYDDYSLFTFNRVVCRGY